MARSSLLRSLCVIAVGLSLLLLVWVLNQRQQTDYRPVRRHAGGTVSSGTDPLTSRVDGKTDASGLGTITEHGSESGDVDHANGPANESPQENRWGTAQELQDLERRGYRDWDRVIPQSAQIAVLRNPVPFLYSDDDFDRQAALDLVCGALNNGPDAELWAEVLKANERIPTKDRGLFMYAIVGTGLPEAQPFMLNEMPYTDAVREYAVLLEAACERCRMEIETGGRVSSQTYPEEDAASK